MPIIDDSELAASFYLLKEDVIRIAAHAKPTAFLEMVQEQPVQR
jgi:hypothetical protein